MKFRLVYQEAMSFKKIISIALAACLFGGLEPFVQYWKKAS